MSGHCRILRTCGEVVGEDAVVWETQRQHCRFQTPPPHASLLPPAPLPRRESLVAVLHLSHAPTQTVASAASNKWEATNFCKCIVASWLCDVLFNALPGICFQTNSTILHLDLPDNPAQPCLSCTKKWCLNQNLPICAGASLGDTNPDTATGKEGDVEARCFRAQIMATKIAFSF